MRRANVPMIDLPELELDPQAFDQGKLYEETQDWGEVESSQQVLAISGIYSMG